MKERLVICIKEDTGGGFREFSLRTLLLHELFAKLLDVNITQSTS